MSISLRSQRGPAANSKSIFSSSLNFSWLLFSFHSIFSHPFSWLLMNFHFLPPSLLGLFPKKSENFSLSLWMALRSVDGKRSGVFCFGLDRDEKE